MLANTVELVKYVDGLNDTVTISLDEYGVNIERGQDLRAVINLQAAVQFARNLIAVVEAVEQAEDDEPPYILNDTNIAYWQTQIDF